MHFKIAVLVPTGGFCKTFFVHSLVSLMVCPTHLIQRPDATGLEVTMLIQELSVIHHNREQLAKRAMDWGATHLLFVDDDMAFDPAVLSIMLGRKQPFVACNYPKRGAPIGFTALSADAKEFLIVEESSTGLVPGSYAGLGMALIERQVFEAIPQPWFLPWWDPEKSDYVGEDFAFCDAAKEAGFPVQIDMDASKLISHMGSMLFHWQQYDPSKPLGPKFGAK